MPSPEARDSSAQSHPPEENKYSPFAPGLTPGIQADRVILHVDMNSFFASVELLSFPELRDQPVVVGGDPEARHGVVLAKNEVAKRRGIETAETLYTAKQKAPNLVVLPPHRDRYRTASRAARKIYHQYTDRVEAYSLDECWLDVSQRPELEGIRDPGERGARGAALAHEIRERIKRELGLTVSIGVSWNKVFAKLGSDYKKPDAVTLITPGNFRELLYPLPIERMLYVGPVAGKTLRRSNIRTIGQLAELEPHVLQALIGKQGLWLSDAARGLDRSPVLRPDEVEEAKSVSSYRTFSSDITDPSYLRDVIRGIVRELSGELKAKGLRCQTVQLNLKWQDFTQISRQRNLPRATQDGTWLEEEALRILEERVDLVQPVRALGVTLSKLSPADLPVQMSLEDLMKKEPSNEGELPENKQTFIDQLPAALRDQLRPARELLEEQSRDDQAPED